MSKNLHIQLLILSEIRMNAKIDPNKTIPHPIITLIGNSTPPKPRNIKIDPTTIKDPETILLNHETARSIHAGVNIFISYIPEWDWQKLRHFLPLQQASLQPHTPP